MTTETQRSALDFAYHIMDNSLFVGWGKKGNGCLDEVWFCIDQTDLTEEAKQRNIDRVNLIAKALTPPATSKVKTAIQALMKEKLPSTATAVADKHWHDDINDAVECAESSTVERMETAITACQSWDTAGLVNEGLVTDMATAYLVSRKKQALTTPSADDLAKVRDALMGAALRFRLLTNNRLSEAIRPEVGRKEVLAAIEILDRMAKAVG